MSVAAKPALPTEIAKLGDIMQLSFMGPDFDAQLAFWTGVVGAGPFFLNKKVELETVFYMGEPADIDFQVAIGYWGDIQVELIWQKNDAPSIYIDWQKSGRQGLHHVCLLTDDLDNARAVCVKAGCVIAQEGTLPGGRGRFLYADPGSDMPLVEIMEAGPQMHEAFAMMRQAHLDWDGSNPVRSRNAAPAPVTA